MNKFKKLSAVILALCTAATVLTSCNKNENNNPTTNIETKIITEIITKKETVTVNITDDNGEVSVSVSEKIVTVPVTKIITTKKNITAKLNTTVTTQKNVITQANNNPSNPVQVSTAATQKSEIKTTIPPIITTPATTKKPVVDDKINEQSVGISMLTKSESVLMGNQATIFIQGTPGKTYSIEFYETPSSVANLTSLEDKKADKNGIVSWTFEIRNTCNLGKRKLVVKEKNSSNYLETSITVK